MRLLAGLTCAVVFSTACAQGSGADPGYSQGDGGYGGTAGAAGSQSGSGPGPGATTGATSASTTATASAGAGGHGGAGGGSSSSTGGAGGAAGAGAGGAQGSCDFTASNSCIQAEGMTSINGDTGNDDRTITGAKSQWFQLEVKEGSDLIEQLSYTATLTSPPGVQFDLFVYDGNGKGPKCNASPVQGTGTPVTVTETWPDNWGSDDSTWLTLEVRHATGGENAACDPTATWTLDVAGHTHP